MSDEDLTSKTSLPSTLSIYNMPVPHLSTPFGKKFLQNKSVIDKDPSPCYNT